MMESKKNQPEIFVTDETKAVVEHYLQKQYERRAKREAKKQAAMLEEGYTPKPSKAKKAAKVVKPAKLTKAAKAAKAAKALALKQPKPKEIWNPRTGKFTIVE